MRKVMGILGAIVVVTVVAAIIVARVQRPATPNADPPRYVSMAESGRAMQQAGATMQAHGQTMRDEGQRTGDRELRDHGDHWLRDGQALVQGGTWMAMDPTAPGNLASSPEALAASGNWARLQRYSAAMRHDPNRNGGGVDLEALRANGLGMQADSQAMAEPGRVMAEEVDTLVARHQLDGQATAELRQATATLRDAGDVLTRDGQEPVAYADRLK